MPAGALHLMTAANYPTCLAHILRHEGGWANHPNDPGGATMRGVIQRVYDGYRDLNKLSRRSVRMIEDRELQEIYRKQYWNAIRGDELPVGIDLVVFDQAVNSGPVQSAKWLQRALGVTADGHIGAATLDALLQNGAHEAIVNHMCDQRLTFLKSLRGGALWKTFGVGWARRVADVRMHGVAMAKQAFAAAPASVPMPEPRPTDGYMPVEAVPHVPATPPLVPETEPYVPPVTAAPHVMEAAPGSAKAPAPAAVESQAKDPSSWGTVVLMATTAVAAVTRAVGEFFEAIKPVISDPVFLFILFALGIGGGGYVLYKRREKIKMGLG